MEGGPGNPARGRRLFGADVQLLAGLAVLMMAGMNGTNGPVDTVPAKVAAAIAIWSEADEKVGYSGGNNDEREAASRAYAAIGDAVREYAGKLVHEELVAHGCRHPDSKPTNEHTPEATRGEAAWQEMVWRQAFNAFLSAVPRETWSETLDATIAESCAHMADAALVEWKKRWQR